MKKTISIVLCLLMVFSCLSVMSATAVATEVKIRCGEKIYKSQLGEEFTYTLELKTPELIENGQFEIVYSGGVRAYAVSYNKESLGSAVAHISPADSSVYLNFSNNEAIYDFTEKKILLEIKFNIIGEDAKVELNRNDECLVVSDKNDINITTASEFNEFLNLEEATPKEYEVLDSDILGESKLVGENYVITNKSNGEEIIRWTASDEPTQIGSFEEGENYILTPVGPPSGFGVAEHIEFMVFWEDESVKVNIISNTLNKTKTEDPPVEEKNIVSEICELAKLQIGKHGVDYCNGQTKAWGNQGLNEWNSIFLAYLMEQVGISPRDDTGWAAYIPSWVANAKSKEIYYSRKSGIEPVVGDLVVFQYKDSKIVDHIGIVIGMDNNGKIKTVEGNTNGNNYKNTVVAERVYDKDSKDILGFISMRMVYKERQDNPFNPETTPTKKEKKKNPVKIIVFNKSIKYAKVKKSKVTFTALEVKNAKGSVTYTKISSKSSKNLLVNRKTGKITVKKKTGRGTYKITIKIKISGTKNYMKKTVYKKLKIKITK